MDVARPPAAKVKGSGSFEFWTLTVPGVAGQLEGPGFWVDVLVLLAVDVGKDVGEEVGDWVVVVLVVVELVGVGPPGIH